MADTKSSKSTNTDMELLCSALRDVDAFAQNASRNIASLVEAIKLMLIQPDSGQLRENIAALCDQIKARAFEASADINTFAEQHGCKYVDEQDRAMLRQMHEAARKAPQKA